MDSDGFKRYLKQGGRSTNAINRCVKNVILYEDYLKESRQGTDLNDAQPDDLNEFIRTSDRESVSRSKSYLWAIRYYYKFMDNLEMSKLAEVMREERIDRKPFSLKDFRDVNQEYIKVLADRGIQTTDQILKAAATKESRRSLIELTGIPEAQIEEFVKLADLARIPGVKSTRARLYFEAGFDSVAKIAGLEPEEFRVRVVDYVRTSGFDGVPTLPAEAEYTIEKARELPIIVEGFSDD